MWSERNRLKSFEKKWYHGNNRKLARNGFFRPNKNEHKAKCYFCNLEICDFEEICMTHVMLSPQCPLLSSPCSGNEPINIIDTNFEINEVIQEIKVEDFISKIPSPDLIYFENRAATFEKTDTDETQVLNFAADGFYFDADSSAIKCIVCDVVYPNLNVILSVTEQHVIASPSCEYIIFKRGHNYISHVLKTIQGGS